VNSAPFAVEYASRAARQLAWNLLIFNCGVY
jgi:hypothetical protein